VVSVRSRRRFPFVGALLGANPLSGCQGEDAVTPVGTADSDTSGPGSSSSASVGDTTTGGHGSSGDDADTTASPGESTGSGGTTAGVEITASLSEVDCHGRDGVEIAAAAGTDLGGLEIVINGATDYTIPAGTISEGLLVVREAQGADPGLAANIGCSDDTVALVLDGVTLDTATFPAFPGSFKGTTWCAGVSADPFALCTPTLGEANLAYVDPGDILFDRLDPIEIDLTIDAAGIAALEVDPRSYVEGTFSVTTDGATTDPIAIGIALKGSIAGSFADLSGKAAFKLKFDFVDADTRFLGLEGLKLNNMREDPSQLHEAMAYWVLGELAVPVPRSGYAEVRLNGDSYGLHATIERVDDVWLSRFFEETQHLYEGTADLDVNPGREDEFAVDEGDPLDTSDLTALMATTVLPDDMFFAGLDAHVHLDAVLRVWAASLRLSHGDGYATARNNYSIHSDDAGMFDFIPSGFDQTQQFLVDVHGDSIPVENRGVLFDRCLADPQCLDRYDQAIAEVDQVLAGLDAQTEIDAIAAAIQPWVDVDPRREQTLLEVELGQDQTRAFWVDLGTVIE
jgi:hypothetical protein